MKVLLSWLKEFVDLNVTEVELAPILTMAGFEVEAVEHFVADFEKVVVGQILEIKAHPNADRLTLCKVNVGSEILAIVCGAKNISPMDYVPVALDGAKLSGGKTLKASKIRGEFSQGMMCSAEELGLNSSEDGILILRGQTPQLGTEFAKCIRLPDAGLEVNVTPNRPDALSIRGIAKEVAAVTGSEIHPVLQEFEEKHSPTHEKVKVIVENPEACPRYMGRLIQNVKVGPSPLWFKQRLERMGERSINNVVDITNAILLELGHPLHAFDFDKVKDAKIIVRQARDGEKMMTLDGDLRTLESSMLVIADSTCPIAVAGVMGGKDTEVNEGTKNIFLECATFAPRGIRRTSKVLGLTSESSYRFERGVDPLGLPEALNRAAMLIQELAGGEVFHGAMDVYEKEMQPRKIFFRPDRCRKLLGSMLGDEEIRSVFSRLQFRIEKSHEGWHVQVPTVRLDLQIEADLIEEVARLWGYEKIEEHAPQSQIQSGMEPFSKAQMLRDRARSILQGLGLNEMITYSFLSEAMLKKAFAPKEAVGLLNPVRQDLSHLRTSLIPNLLSILSLNRNRGSLDIQGYEIGKCFFDKGVESFPPQEVEFLGIVMMGRGDGLLWRGGREGLIPLDFFYLKGRVEEFLKAIGLSRFQFQVAQKTGCHPGRSAEVVVGGDSIGYIAEGHPDLLKNFDLREKVFFAELDLERVASKMDSKKSFKELPRYPSIERDIAVVIDQAIPHENIESEIRLDAPNILEAVSLFDVYEGAQIPEGKKSLAYSLRFRSREGTLKDEEVDAVEAAIKEKLTQKLNCQFR